MPLMKSFSRGLGSFGFAVVLLLFLLVLTWLGTLEQVELGLYETQKKYFDSMWLVHWTEKLAFKWPWSDAEPLFRLPSIPIPLPGVYLLLALLMLNLVVGGILRLKKDVRRLGILVAHLGIVLMLAAGFVKYRWSYEGNLPLWPVEWVSRGVDPVALAMRGDDSYLNAPRKPESNEFHSYQEWELVVHEAVDEGVVREHLVSMRDWIDLDPGRQRTFTSDALPFDVAVTRGFKNCRLTPKGPMFAGDGPVIDGYVVRKQETDKEAEFNIPGVYATFTEKASGRQTDAILWGAQRHPFTLAAGGKQWVVDLRRKIYSLPFALRLEKFLFEMHPGTGTAKVYLSHVTKIEEHEEQALQITMNEPLRAGGFTLYQSSYGPKDVRPGEPAYSVFAVVYNPSDQWPKWSCYVIALGLLFHFSSKLFRWVKSEHKKPPAPPKPAEPARTGPREVDSIARSHA
jgi:hypothetical protein